MQIDEKNLISNFMRNLSLTEEEAKELLKQDEKINKMKTTEEINSDLTEEQKKISRITRQSDRHSTNFKLDSTKRKKTENPDKQFLIESLRDSLEATGAAVTILNPEREFEFIYNEVKYKIVLSVPRK